MLWWAQIISDCLGFIASAEARLRLDQKFLVWYYQARLGECPHEFWWPLSEKWESSNLLHGTLDLNAAPCIALSANGSIPNILYYRLGQVYIWHFTSVKQMSKWTMPILSFVIYFCSWHDSLFSLHMNACENCHCCYIFTYFFPTIFSATYLFWWWGSIELIELFLFLICNILWTWHHQ